VYIERLAGSAYSFLQVFGDGALVGQIQPFLFRDFAQKYLLQNERPNRAQGDRPKIKFFPLYLQKCYVPGATQLGTINQTLDAAYFSSDSPSARDVATEDPGWEM
jgi:hypothetical protein